MTDELRIDERPQLERPVLIAAFRGWNDGGQGASLAGAYLAQAWAAEQFAVDRLGELLRLPGDAADGLARRRVPRARSTGPRTPSCTRRCRAAAATRSSCSASSRTSAGARSASTSSGLATSFGVELVITLGSLLADVPHTRPAPVTGSATDPELIEQLGLQASRYEGPTGIVGVLHDACGRAGHRRPRASGRPSRTTSR